MARAQTHPGAEKLSALCRTDAALGAFLRCLRLQFSLWVPGHKTEIAARPRKYEGQGIEAASGILAALI